MHRSSSPLFSRRAVTLFAQLYHTIVPARTLRNTYRPFVFTSVATVDILRFLPYTLPRISQAVRGRIFDTTLIRHILILTFSTRTVRFRAFFRHMRLLKRNLAPSTRTFLVFLPSLSLTWLQAIVSRLFCGIRHLILAVCNEVRILQAIFPHTPRSEQPLELLAPWPT